MILEALFEKRATKVSIGHPSTEEAWIKGNFAPGPALSGVQVNKTTALQYGAFFAACKILSDVVSTLPFNVYERLPDEGKKVARQHPVHQLLHLRPNPEMTAASFRSTMQLNLSMFGDAVAEIERNQRGQPMNLWPIHPDNIDLMRLPDRSLIYEVKGPDTRQGFLAPRDVIHVVDLSTDGRVGLSTILNAREAIGAGLAAEQFGARWFGQGSQLGGIIEHPAELDETSEKNLRAWLDANHKGLEQAHRILLLQQGMKYQASAVPPKAAQLIETRRENVNEMARWKTVPPHKLAEMTRSTFSNIEEQEIEFVVYTIRHLLVRWEQEINWKLFGEAERETFFAEHVIDGLLRGNVKDRWESYSKGFQIGGFSVNDILKLENRNTIGPDGDVRYRPSALTPVGEEPAVPAEPEPGDTPAEDDEEEDIRQRWLQDCAERVLGKEARELAKALNRYNEKRDIDWLNGWIRKFYATHDEAVCLAFEAVVSDEERLGVEARRYCDDQCRRVLETWVNGGSSDGVRDHDESVRELVDRMRGLTDD